MDLNKPDADKLLGQAVQDLKGLLVASCDCLTKSPAFSSHSGKCRYRVLGEAIGKIRAVEHMMASGTMRIHGENNYLASESSFPEAMSAFHRIKNGWHFHDDPKPSDTSENLAFSQLLRAAAGFATYGQPGTKIKLHRDEDMYVHPEFVTVVPDRGPQEPA